MTATDQTDTTIEISTWAALRNYLITMALAPVLVLATIAIAFGVAGYVGLESVLATVLAEPKVSAWMLMMGGLGLFVVMIFGTFSVAKSGEMLGSHWSSLWIPFQVVFVAAVFIPSSADSLSIAAHTGLWALKIGAGLV